MSSIEMRSARRELAQRSANGIDVTLYWRPADDSLAVVVNDEHANSLELGVAAHEALDVFEHPYAYAALRGIELAEAPLEAAA